MIKKMRGRLKNQKGMTLIELLAVIVILGIIAAIAVPSIGGMIQKSKEDAVKADAITILNAGKLYVAAYGVDSTDGNLAMDSTKLGEFLETTTSFGTNYTVNYNGSTYTISTDTNGIQAGKIKIVFTNATINGINAAKKGTTLINS